MKGLSKLQKHILAQACEIRQKYSFDEAEAKATEREVSNHKKQVFAEVSKMFCVSYSDLLADAKKFNVPDITCGEVMIAYYKFPPAVTQVHRNGQWEQDTWRRNSRGYVSHRKVNRREVDKGAYQSAKAAITRAFRRLVNRGLLERRIDGYKLTPLGRETVA